MDCLHCGAHSPDGATFCPHCGRPVRTTLLHDNGSEGYEPPMVGGAPHLSPVSWRHDLHVSARWIRRVCIPLAALAWIGLVTVLLWAASYVARSLILLTIAGILAYALAPLVKWFQRIMPRFLAILIVYVVVLGSICGVVFFLSRAAIDQVEALRNQTGGLLQPGPSSPLQGPLASLGIDASQMQNVRQTLTGRLGGLVNDVVPVLRGVFDFVVDVIVVAMLSIYLLIDGERVFRWLRENMPLRQQRRGFFLLDTLESVVGGYIRGQLMLALLIGVLVGAGMAIFRVPHPILLGEVAFLLAFIPVMGTFISGSLCVLLALTATTSWVTALTAQTWILGVIVLLYFVAMHFIESHIVGPRIVGHAVGLHPVISIAALIAGAELFGILGALLVAPCVGLLQAIIIWLWRDWRASHPSQFPTKPATVESLVSEEKGQANVET